MLFLFAGVALFLIVLAIGTVVVATIRGARNERLHRQPHPTLRRGDGG